MFDCSDCPYEQVQENVTEIGHWLVNIGQQTIVDLFHLVYIHLGILFLVSFPVPLPNFIQHIGVSREKNIISI